MFYMTLLRQVHFLNRASVGLKRIGTPLLFILLLCNRAGFAQPAPTEYQVKAAFIYNFTKFVNWPEAPEDSNKSFCIGVLGNDPFGSLLDEAITGRTTSGRTVMIKRSNDPDTLLRCQLVFIARTKKDSDAPARPWSTRELKAILNQFQAHPILTVSDLDRFAEIGGIIHLRLQNDKVRFSINNQAATRAGLRISSKLLNLATIVSSSDSAP